jgi:hypothetical protein
MNPVVAACATPIDGLRSRLRGVRLSQPSGRLRSTRIGRAGDSLNLAMLTAIECLDRAAEFEDRAEQSGDPDARAQLNGLAQGWRRLAVRAYVQDVFRPLALKVPTVLRGVVRY